MKLLTAIAIVTSLLSISFAGYKTFAAPIDPAFKETLLGSCAYVGSALKPFKVNLEADQYIWFNTDTTGYVGVVTNRNDVFVSNEKNTLLGKNFNSFYAPTKGSYVISYQDSDGHNTPLPTTVCKHYTK